MSTAQMWHSPIGLLERPFQQVGRLLLAHLGNHVRVAPLDEIARAFPGHVIPVPVNEPNELVVCGRSVLEVGLSRDGLRRPPKHKDTTVGCVTKHDGETGASGGYDQRQISTTPLCVHDGVCMWTTRPSAG